MRTPFDKFPDHTSYKECYAKISEVYEKIAHLAPFSQKETEIITNCLNKKYYQPKDELSFEVEYDEDAYGSLYPKVSIKEWKSFCERMTKKLENIPKTEYIYLSHRHCYNQNEDIQVGSFTLTFPDKKRTGEIDERVVREIIIAIEKNRDFIRLEEERKEKERILKEKEEQRKNKIYELLVKLQNNEITIEEFKNQSEIL